MKNTCLADVLSSLFLLTCCEAIQKCFLVLQIMAFWAAGEITILLNYNVGSGTCEQSMIINMQVFNLITIIVQMYDNCKVRLIHIN